MEVLGDKPRPRFLAVEAGIASAPKLRPGRRLANEGLRAWCLVVVLAAAAGALCCHGYKSVRAPVQKSSSPQSQLKTELLYEQPLDNHQEGLFSNTGSRRQVGGGQFVFSDAFTVTGILWYGYYNCNFNPIGTSPIFDISFFPDDDGLPAAEPIYAGQMQAHVAETKAGVPNPPFDDHNVYVYTVDTLPPLLIPAGRRMWISISEAPGVCEWLWARSNSVDGETSAWGTSENGRLFRWTHLKDHLAFSLYGLEKRGWIQGR